MLQLVALALGEKASEKLTFFCRRLLVTRGKHYITNLYNTSFPLFIPIYHSVSPLAPPGVNASSSPLAGGLVTTFQAFAARS